MSENNEELFTPSTDEKIQSVLALIEEQKNSPYESRFDEILDGFEDFLMMRPDPPKEWQERFNASGKKFDYWQIVLPQDFQDPFEDDLGNIRRLRNEFADTKPSMALEHLLISRNYFLYENGHAKPIPAPRPILMLESMDDEKSKIDWDCCFTLFADGSFYAYNLDQDDEEELGEDFQAILQKRLGILSEMRLIVPAEGRDYGILHS
ncbi:MAG: hypothetical protein SOZ02_09245 [Hallerella porci]|uniref:Uncharacterized protein n=1 Tax=Hallerella porci TaxID=1945871 RepID=A0ABX5LNH0_9BACT|nr:MULTISPECIES: hypothetical protein [Hallerella]MCI5600215.1 hypothetical protein [Hallerella sp.]MDY3922330.1 hypothetical protein [Hallerella porci]PWL03449.1 hypothetical protein B0H50_106109 [Hallerella porci]